MDVKSPVVGADVGYFNHPDQVIAWPAKVTKTFGGIEAVEATDTEPAVPAQDAPAGSRVNLTTTSPDGATHVRENVPLVGTTDSPEGYAWLPYRRRVVEDL